MTRYVYQRSEPGLWTVGFFRPDGRWHSESDHDSREGAAQRVAWLNGAAPEPIGVLRVVIADADSFEDEGGLHCVRPATIKRARAVIAKWERLT